MAVLFLPNIVSAQDNNRPNVIMLVVDDWNDMIGAFGNKQIQTPNIDKLCQRGVYFTNNHAAAVYCTPSRTALMTGVAPWNSGCYSDQTHHFNMPERMTMSQLFKKNGYLVYGGGKVFHHMPGYVDLRGYDEYFHWNPAQKKKGWGLFAWRDNAATPAEIPASEFGKTVYKNFDVKALPNDAEKDMADTKLCDWAINFLEENHDSPFFLSIGLYSPHKPNFAPQKYFDLYPIETVEKPAILENDEDDLPPLVQNIIKRRAAHTHNKLITIDDGWRRAIQGYMAGISYADAQLGRVLDALEKSKYAENTIIVFWSDNGYHLGEKKCWAKHSLWERTTNVPMVWAGPGIKRGKEYRGVTSLLDIYPTFIEQCNLKQAQKTDGKSIVDQLAKPEKVLDRAVITADKEGTGFSIFTNEWHYLNYKFGEAEELYDVRKDKNEWDNLASNSKYKIVKEDLKKILPRNPSPAAKGRKEVKLVFHGETFKWVEKNHR